MFEFEILSRGTLVSTLRCFKVEAYYYQPLIFHTTMVVKKKAAKKVAKKAVKKVAKKAVKKAAPKKKVAAKKKVAKKK